MRKLLNQKGNSFIEVALFSPLAIAFILGVVNTSLKVIQDSNIDDALRSGIESDLLNSNRQSIYSKTSSGDLVLNQEAISQSVERISQEIYSALINHNDIDDSNIEIRTIAVEIVVEGDTGKSSSYNLLPITSVYPKSSTPKSDKFISELSHSALSVGNFIYESTFDKTNFSIAQAPSQSDNNLKVGYANSSIAYYIEISYLPKSKTISLTGENLIQKQYLQLAKNIGL